MELKCPKNECKEVLLYDKLDYHLNHECVSFIQEKISAVNKIIQTFRKYNSKKVESANKIKRAFFNFKNSHKIVKTKLALEKLSNHLEGKMDRKLCLESIMKIKSAVSSNIQEEVKESTIKETLFKFRTNVITQSEFSNNSQKIKKRSISL